MSRKETKRGILKIGDLVRVRKDIRTDSCFENVTFVSEMEKYKGLITRVSYIDKDGDLHLEGCDTYWFDPDMVELVSEEELGMKNIKIRYDDILNTYFINVGDSITICAKYYGLSSKHPEDKENREIGDALAYYRLKNQLVLE